MFIQDMKLTSEIKCRCSVFADINKLYTLYLIYIVFDTHSIQYPVSICPTGQMDSAIIYTMVDIIIYKYNNVLIRSTLRYTKIVFNYLNNCLYYLL